MLLVTAPALFLCCGEEPQPRPPVGIAPDVAAADEVSLDAVRAACFEDFDGISPCQASIRLAAEEESLADGLGELLLAAADDDPRDWLPRFLLGYYFRRLSRIEEAIEAFETSAALAAEADDPLGEAAALRFVVWGLERRGRREEAKAALQRGIDRAEAAGDRIAQGRLLYKQASLFAEEGRQYDRLKAIRRCAEVVAVDSNDVAVRRSTYQVGTALLWLGRQDEARAQIERAAELSRLADDVHSGWRAETALGYIAMIRDDADVAIRHFDDAIDWAARSDDPGAEIFARQLRCEALLADGRAEEAVEILETLAPGARRVGGEEEPYNRLYLGRALLAAGRPLDAIPILQAAIELSTDRRLPTVEFRAMVAASKAHTAVGRHEEAVALAEKAVAVAGERRGGAREDAARLRFLQIRMDAFQTLARARFRARPSDVEGVYEAVELAHAQTLRESVEGVAPAGLLAPRSLGETRRALRDGDLVVEYLLGETHSIAVAIDRESVQVVELPARRTLESLSGRYVDAIRRPLHSVDARVDPRADFRRFSDLGRELYDALLAPFADRLARSRRLIVIPDRKLYRLPFEALIYASERDRSLFVGGKLAVAYGNAASLLDPAPNLGGGSIVVATAGGAVVSEGLAPLLHSGREAAAVLGAYPQRSKQHLFGETATLARLTNALGGPVEVLHVIAHGAIDGVTGPRIFLQDGTLDRPSILALPSPPRLIVLSACESAAGELVGGEGLLGLVRAFTELGAPQIVASLWKVDDAGTAGFMGRVHGAVGAGRSPSSALFEARRSLLAEGFAHPFVWSGFVLYGSD